MKVLVHLSPFLNLWLSFPANLVRLYLLCHIYRAEYNPDQYLWEKEFTLASRTYQRQDLEASMDSIYLMVFVIIIVYI